MLQKIVFKPGVNRENTRYTNEGGWYESEKVRFRQGTPEKIGGWERISPFTYEGVCRSLWTWSTITDQVVLNGVGTHLKFYIEEGGGYNDVTPARAYASALSGPFAATSGSTTITVTDNSHGCQTGDYVSFLGATSLSDQTFTRVNATDFTLSTALADNTPVQMYSDGGTLPAGLDEGITYYAQTNQINGTAVVSGIGQAIVGLPTQVNLFITTTIGGRSLADITNNGSVGGDDLSAYNLWVSGLLTNQTQIDYIENVMNPYMQANPVTYAAYINPNTQFSTVPDGAVVSTTTAGTGTFHLFVSNGITSSILNQNFAVTVLTGNTYTIESPVPATVYDVGSGGTVNATYEIPIGYELATSLSGWGIGTWGTGPWGVGSTTTLGLRSWWQVNFGEDLFFGYRGGPLYYWNASYGTTPAPATISIATPAVITYSGSALSDGEAIVFESTGALPTGLSIGTVYYVRNASGSTFNVSATPSGAVIDTTGTQSGTHYISIRAIPVTDLAGASDVPIGTTFGTVSDISRFAICFGTNPLGEAELDPMFIRWADQESLTDWTPSATNQAGGQRLSHGSRILTAVQTRQEIVVFTDTSLYSMQYLGPPYVWGFQLLGDNISMSGYNTAALASGIIYWMGVDKFYRYDGRVQTLRCDLRNHVFSNINLAQQDQFFASTNEGFNEVWWFYCSANATRPDLYVVYNYVEDIWYYGSLERSAWIDSGLNEYPLAATYSNNLVFHELGVDDNTSGTPAAIDAYITSAQFDIGDGHNIGFVWRMIPDLTFRNSSTTGETPRVTMYLLPLKNSGSGYNNQNVDGNQSEGGTSFANVDRIGAYDVDQFTGQIYTRVRGRQMSFKVRSNRVGTQWQLGSPRIDIRPDGRR